MPSPLAHTAVGYIIYRLARPCPEDSRYDPLTKRIGPLPLLLIFTGVASLLPDLDAVLGVLGGDIGAYHNQVTHSLWTGLLVSLLLAGILWWKTRAGFRSWFFPIFLSYELHVVMDFFTFGRGVMLFWPFSTTRYSSPVQIFVGVRWDHGIFSPDHLWTLLTESIFVAAMFLIAALLKRLDASTRLIHETGCQPGD